MHSMHMCPSLHRPVQQAVTGARNIGINDIQNYGRLHPGAGLCPEESLRVSGLSLELLASLPAGLPAAACMAPVSI